MANIYKMAIMTIISCFGPALFQRDFGVLLGLQALCLASYFLGSFCDFFTLYFCYHFMLIPPIFRLYSAYKCNTCKDSENAEYIVLDVRL